MLAKKGYCTQVRDRQVELVRQVYEAVCPDYDDEVVRQGALPPSPFL